MSVFITYKSYDKKGNATVVEVWHVSTGNAEAEH